MGMLCQGIDPVSAAKGLVLYPELPAVLSQPKA